MWYRCEAIYGAIEQSWSNEIASKGNANEKLWFLWRHVKIKNANCVSKLIFLD